MTDKPRISALLQFEDVLDACSIAAADLRLQLAMIRFWQFRERDRLEGAVMAVKAIQASLEAMMIADNMGRNGRDG